MSFANPYLAMLYYSKDQLESNVLAFAFYAPEVLMSTYEDFKKYYRENIRLYNT